MAILQSWWCWRSVRKGSFACGLYTAVYYTITAAHSSVVLHEELKFLNNCSSPDVKATFLDHDTTSQTSMTFTLLLLSISSCGILTSCLLLYGLYRDCKILLIPWIITIILFTMHDIVYICYNFIEHALKWNPIVAVLITIDLFINSLNVYALLCVISQYQELKAGRGRALDDQNIRVPNIHYSSQPTATSYLSTRRREITCHETRPTPTQSPTGTAPHTSLGADEASPNTFNKGPRKSVKFDHISPTHNGSQHLEPPWSLDVKSNNMLTTNSKGDTAPLIEPGPDSSTVLQSNL